MYVMMKKKCFCSMVVQQKIFRAGPFPWQTDTPRTGHNRILRRTLVHTWNHFSETSHCYRYFSWNSQNFFELSKFKNTYIRLTLTLPLVINGMCYTSQINTFRGTNVWHRQVTSGKYYFKLNLKEYFWKFFKTDWEMF